MCGENLNKVIELYSNQLLTFGYLDLPKFYQPSSFKERIDTSLVNLIQTCPKIETLVSFFFTYKYVYCIYNLSFFFMQMVREKISTCTLLLISYYGYSLRYLYIRRNAVILRCDWPRLNDWSEEFYQWLKKSSMSYEIVEKEIALSLGVEKWTMLNDCDYKRLSPQLHTSYFK